MDNKWANYGKWRHGEQRQKYIDAMNNNQDNQIDLIGDAYMNYRMNVQEYEKLPNSNDVNSMKMTTDTQGNLHPSSVPFNKEQFINKIKTDKGFAKRWDITIETRELSLDQRMEYYFSNISKNKDLEEKAMTHTDEQKMQYLQILSVGNNIPTKLTTINYNGQTQESYE